MGKKANQKGNDAVILSKTSEGNLNQGFLKVLAKKATHRLKVEEPGKSRKGLKSGEPFSSINHTNLSAKKGRK